MDEIYRHNISHLQTRISIHTSSRSLPDSAIFSSPPSVACVLGRTLAASILRSPICTRFPSVPLGRALAASIRRSPISTRSLYASASLGRALPASILRSPICTLGQSLWATPFQPPFSDPRSPLSVSPFGPRPCSLHSPIPDLHSRSVPLAAPFQPQFSDPRSPLSVSPFGPRSSSPNSPIPDLHSPPPAPLRPKRPLLGHPLPASILRSSICTRAVMAHGAEMAIHTAQRWRCIRWYRPTPGQGERRSADPDAGGLGKRTSFVAGVRRGGGPRSTLRPSRSAIM